ncbi:molecular chaperone [Klebsiella sp. BIGb0407]|uniref:fimbrial biogenesis chaperone n=1 Tax=Klebsiella sp. BIGb0407 TaxID=2940603 RepID=UPI0021672D02|nr:fimbria/pilus periplasmic chaperone [Klebsiella sp. BIGb0407]MCS3433412.1 fimbrial chaperone protein [Klebsiella sp. BIGb0407]
MLKKITLIASLLFCCQGVYAGGVSLGATRLIYPIDKNQVTLKVYNSDKGSNYLVQSWITDEKNNKVSDFIITPPLFVIKSDSDNLLNVVYTGDKNNLPKDREKLYFLNTKVIPSLTEEEQKIDNALLISTTTKIKLFTRPTNLHNDSFASYEKIKCSYENNKLKIENPTPFYMNLSSLRVNGKEISTAETIAPMTAAFLNTTDKSKNLKFNFINDYGVQVKDKQCSFN